MRERNELILADMIAVRAEDQPDLDVLTFEGGGVRPDEQRTYQDLWENGNRIAAGLIARGMHVGDRFGVLIRNHPEFVDVMVGASIAGCVLVPIDPRSRGAKLAYTLRNSDCKGILCADYSAAQVAGVRADCPDLDWVWVLECGEDAESMPASALPGAAPLQSIYDEPYAPVDVRIDDPKAPFEIMYTSGTTGDPKGVVLSNERYCGSGMIGMLVGYNTDDRPYTGLSLTHGNAQLITLCSSLRMGMRAVFSRKFTKSRLWDICREYGCTTFNLLGGMTTAIYSEPAKPNDGDNPVRLVISAGMPAAIWKPFAERFNVEILEAYGTVEGGMAVNRPGEGPIGSFGKPAPGLEMKIVDDDGNECPPHVPGELIARPVTGEKATVEYFKDKEASEKKTWGGWLRSGDVCHQDEDGWLYFDYRKGGGIRHNGDFVNPGFVERVVADHPAVTDVFVYGVPAASGAPGEKDVVAAVVPVDRVAFDAAAVFAACREGLEPNFVPGYLQVVDEIPKTASEKPQERFLLDRFAPDAPGVYTEL